MKLKFNRKTELEVVGLGVFQPNVVITISDDKGGAKKYLDTGYFDLVKEKKRKVKNLKRKELINNAISIKTTLRN